MAIFKYVGYFYFHIPEGIRSEALEDGHVGQNM
jgi:hypothetical protein